MFFWWLPVSFAPLNVDKLFICSHGVIFFTFKCQSIIFCLFYFMYISDNYFRGVCGTDDILFRLTAFGNQLWCERNASLAIPGCKVDRWTCSLCVENGIQWAVDQSNTHHFHKRSPSQRGDSKWGNSLAIGGFESVKFRLRYCNIDRLITAHRS